MTIWKLNNDFDGSSDLTNLKSCIPILFTSDDHMPVQTIGIYFHNTRYPNNAK